MAHFCKPKLYYNTGTTVLYVYVLVKIILCTASLLRPHFFTSHLLSAVPLSVTLQTGWVRLRGRRWRVCVRTHIAVSTGSWYGLSCKACTGISSNSLSYTDRGEGQEDRRCWVCRLFSVSHKMWLKEWVQWTEKWPVGERETVGETASVCKA